MSTFNFLVTIETERDSGKFASRDEQSDQITEAIEESLENVSLSGLGSEGNSEYSVSDSNIEELDNKELKKLWAINETRVREQTKPDKQAEKIKTLIAELRAANGKVATLEGKLEKLQEERKNEETRVVCDPYAEAPLYLPEREAIRFMLDGYDYIDVSLGRDRPNTVQIRGNRGMQLHMISSNLFYATPEVR